VSVRRKRASGGQITICPVIRVNLKERKARPFGRALEIQQKKFPSGALARSGSPANPAQWLQDHQ